ncbi:hypothetical protein B0H17DRAFT_1221977 [Mycena rosella]|uniref:Uncharacterized protein n=1 Tax=Mycena rosella TaxID=1033263 RepID=A0AAD7AZV4_MYCRO|nr:hypothetical protein B0H17DRAFT_1221977 [Mycena rosella]
MAAAFAGPAGRLGAFLRSKSSFYPPPSSRVPSIPCPPTPLLASSSSSRGTDIVSWHVALSVGVSLPRCLTPPPLPPTLSPSLLAAAPPDADALQRPRPWCVSSGGRNVVPLPRGTRSPGFRRAPSDADADERTMRCGAPDPGVRRSLWGCAVSMMRIREACDALMFSWRGGAGPGVPPSIHPSICSFFFCGAPAWALASALIKVILPFYCLTCFSFLLCRARPGACGLKGLPIFDVRRCAARVGVGGVGGGPSGGGSGRDGLVERCGRAPAWPGARAFRFLLSPFLRAPVF